MKRVVAFAGPAYLVSVGYMAPGNWATDLEGGSRFGYALIWGILMSNVMAVLLQTLSARLGIVTGKDLAQACGSEYSKLVSFVLCSSSGLRWKSPCAKATQPKNWSTLPKNIMSTYW
nr:Nramp family divalent metal transporter [Desulfobulbus rhabdoformis]